MRIYQAETDAGINLQANEKGNLSALVTAKVRVCDIEKYDGMSAADLIKTASTIQTVEELLGKEQPDLALIVAILVSTGWNLNDDIFTPEEVWKARQSPLHKPMNDNHDDTKILGHIVQSRVLDKSGDEIELSEGETPPDDFDLEVAGVLYKAFPGLVDRISEIITKAKTGEMYVSMEAWFPDFGYGLINPDTGKTNLIDRTESTAFLTKHLRIYGGCGKYQGYKVGRVLKDIIFGAQGFVDDPANPESVIKVAANKATDRRIFVNAELDELLKGGKDVDEKQLEELQAKLKEVQAVAEEFKAKTAVLESKVKEYDEQITSLNEKVEELTTGMTEASKKVEDAETAKAELQKQLDEAVEKVEKSESELEGIRKDGVARDRLAKLSEIKKVEDEKVTLAELREMTDEAFEIVVKYAGEAKSVNDETETTDEEKAEQAKAALDNATASDDADLNVADNEEETEAGNFMSLAKTLCRQEKDEQGGE